MLMLVNAVLLLACSGGESPVAAPPEPAQPNVENPATEPPAVDKEALAGAEKEASLVPSPTEMQRALTEAGIDKGLSKLVPPNQPPQPGDDRDATAVRVGMDLAYTLLTVSDADTPVPVIVARLEQVKTGMKALGADKDIGPTIDDLVGRLQSDSLTRGGLLSELDELHGAVLPEIEFEAGERIVPLIQAGSWVAGVNLVATAVVNAQKPEAAKLLRQPEVAAYFQRYVRTEGANVAPAGVSKQLDATLDAFQKVASKPELDLNDASTIVKQTSDVLALL